MAEAVLFSLASTILKSLTTEIAKPGGSFASQKIQLLCCAKGELQSLEETVQTIQTVLLDAEKQQWHNDPVKLWLKRLKGMLYDIQDLLDDVATEDLRRKVTSGNKMLEEVRVFFSKSNQLAHHCKVAREIQKLRKKLDRIKSDKEFLHLRGGQTEEKIAIERGKKPEYRAPDTDIIGREEDKKKIINLLFDSSSSQSVSFVGIVGKGGLGKTALARLVYNDGQVKGHFGLKMWVCISADFKVDLIIKQILEGAKDGCQEQDFEMKKLLQDIDIKPKDQLPSLLHDILSRKKYLLVLDDMWIEDRLNWLLLGDWLNGGVQGSKILITTRSHIVAKVADEKSAIYNLEGLPRDLSWTLFREAAFGDGQASVNPRLEEMGGVIVGKCGGVPLAIRTVGTLLYGKNEDEWLRYKVLELPEIPEVDMVDNGIMQYLQFSYDRLTSWLKQCFAYCSLFPKDYVYHTDIIIRLWVAQGFIESRNVEDNLVEHAGRYLSNLLDRSFLDVETVGDEGEVLTFKMHDLMHNLAQKVAGDECKNVKSSAGEFDGRIRHASVIPQNFSQEGLASFLEKSKLRTFLYLAGDGLREESSVLDCRKVFSGFRHCRVLGLGKTDIPLSPSSFGKLKHLRFLDVSGNQSIKILPDSITDLLNLQTLILSHCSNLSTLSRDLRKLVNLRFLDVSNNSSIETLPDSITDLLNLQTLKLSDCRSLTALPRDLKKLINLRHLLIDGCYSLTHMPHGLNNLSSLQTLSKFVLRKMDHRVPGGVGRVDELGGLNKLAGSISLEKLEFLQPAPNKCHLREKECLRSLELWWSSSPREEQDEKSESDELAVWENLRPHQNLTHLAIYYCWGRSPPRWLSSISYLVKLEFIGCRRWKYLPPLSELPSLRELDLVELDELEFVQEMRDPQQSNTACAFFPSLERLSLRFCRKLKGWWGGRRLLVGEEQNHWWHDSRSSFPKLLHVEISNCRSLKSLPPLSEPPSLRELHLVGLNELEFVEEIRDPQQSNTFFPSLERLSLRFCRKLKGWWGGRRLLVGEEQNHWWHDSQSSFPKLLHGEISYCDNLKSLPPLSELPSLRELHLDGLDELEFLEEIRDPQQSNTFFPSLETLRIFHCVKLKGWWGRRLLVGEEQNHWRYDSQLSFPKLLHLDISDCGNLKSLPLLPSVIDLGFHRSSVKVLEQQVVAVPNHSSEAALVSTSIPLSKLKEIDFDDILDLDHSMLETLLPFLRNIESMKFFRCSALRSLSSGMQYLSSLQHLCIDSFEELDLSSHDDEHGTQWRSLTNLRTLTIYELPKLVALPEGIQHVTTLQSLSITRCFNLTSLPEWIGNFSLLQDLEISGCPGIDCLPDGMQNLTSLKRFRISHCPALGKSCQREVGADWEKIKGVEWLLLF